MAVMLETGTGAGTASKTHFCMEAQSTNLVHLNDLMHHLRNHKQHFGTIFRNNVCETQIFAPRNTFT